MNFKSLAFGLLLTAQVTAQTIPNVIARPSVENTSSSNSSYHDACVYSFHGGFAPHASAPSTTSGIRLPEFTFGQPFATFVTPNSTFTQDVLFNGRLLANNTTTPGVYTKLYPTGYLSSVGITQTPEAIKAGTAAFRYKYLMYGVDLAPPPERDANGNPQTDGGGNVITKTPTILNVFESALNPDAIFNDADRDTIREQIQILREALAYDPLNFELQEAFLETHYNWAIAEAQFARTKMANLLKFRMGFLTPIDADQGKTAIDSEIATLEALITDLKKVLEIYGELLETEIDGFNPADIDPSSGGAPFGYYIFKTRVPVRNQYAPPFSSSGGGPVDSIDPGTPVFNGFKDYRTILTILGEYYQRTADLARLLGLRRGDGDVARARRAITELSIYDSRLTEKLERMFLDSNGTPIDFDLPEYDGSGVRAARDLARVARSDAEGMRGFLDGTTNHLGLDPNFLLLVPSPSDDGPFDSFNVLMKQITATNAEEGGIGPLTIARAAYGNPNNPGSGGGANQAFSDFRANVDTVAGEFTDLRADYREEHIKLTGWDPAIIHDPNVPNSPGFDGLNHNPTVASDLRAINQLIDDLSARNNKLIELTEQITKDAAVAREAVSLAREIESTITGAETKYLDDTADAWTELHVWAGAAAAAQGAFDTYQAATSVDFLTTFFGGGSVNAGAAFAGAANTAVQTAAATRTSMRQQEIEEAAIAMDITIATAGLPLTIQQAIMDLNDLYREALSNKLETQENFTAQNQAIAQRNAILLQAGILKQRYEIDYGTLTTSYYADPIFFTRAQSALLKADATFRDAQRWLFYTARALEYKYQTRFKRNGFDISSVLKARNYVELEDVREQLSSFDLAASTADGTVQPHRNVISLRDHVLAVNPADPNLDFSPVLIDKGFRQRTDDDGNFVGPWIPKIERFREILRENVSAEGNLVIEIDTTRLRKFGDLFQGPDFTNPSNSFSGNYRNKIEWLAVNVIAPLDAANPPNTAGRNFNLTYGGLAWNRNRIPVNPATRKLTSAAPEGSLLADPNQLGEYNTHPFVYYQSQGLDLRTFDTRDTRDLGSKFLYSQQSITDSTVVENILIDPNRSFRKATFREYSPIASRITLQIDVQQPNAQLLIENIDDIEIIIQSQSYARPDIGN